jgi:hypothetical protein
MSADQQSLTGEQIKVVAVDFGGYAVAFRLSQWCSKGPPDDLLCLQHS